MSSNKKKMTKGKSLELNFKALSVLSFADIERARVFVLQKVRNKNAKVIEAKIKGKGAE